MKISERVTPRFTVLWLLVAAVLALLLNSAQSQPANVQIIEMTAKKYEYSPSPVHLKVGMKVQLKITALDRKHGFKISPYPDGAKAQGDPGLAFTTEQDCWDLEKGQPTTIEFVAQAPGTYTFHCCHRCGFGHSGMKGQLIVEP